MKYLFACLITLVGLNLKAQENCINLKRSQVADLMKKANAKLITVGKTTDGKMTYDRYDLRLQDQSAAIYYNKDSVCEVVMEILPSSLLEGVIADLNTKFKKVEDKWFNKDLTVVSNITIEEKWITVRYRKI